MNDGWTCPKCGAVMSPFMPTCVNDHSKVTVTTNPLPYPPQGGGGSGVSINRCNTCGGPFAICRGAHTIA